MTARIRRPTLGTLTDLILRAGQALALSWSAAPIAAIVYLLATIAQGLLPAAVTLLTKWLLDSIQLAGDPQAVSAADAPPNIHPMLLVAGIGGLGVALGALPYVGNYAQSRIKRGVSVVVQDRLYRAVNRFDGISRFENPAFLDRLRLAQQSAMTSPGQVTSSIFGILQGGIAVTSLLGVLLVVSPVMVAVTIGAAVPAFFVQLSLSRQQAAMMGKISPRNRRQIFYQTLMLDMSAVKEIRLFGMGTFLVGRIRDETLQINTAEDRLDRKIATQQGPLAAMSAAVAAGGLMWMAASALRGEATVGDVSAFVAAVAGVQGSLAGLVTNATRGYETLLLFGHYIDVIEMTTDLPVPNDPRPAPPLRRGVAVHDVWFRYTNSGPWVLRGLSVDIPAGRSLALVGLNGAGKSTLVKLLCRLYDPVQGYITWDGIDIRDIAVALLRDRISIVFQDYMAYDLTIAENIGLGDLKHLHDRQRIEAAAREAGMEEHVSRLPRGYDTMLSRIFLQNEDESTPEHGVTLSGGQWQRIALARALMRQRRELLILDEPTAGLDAAAEQAFHDSIREYREGATSVLISHRLGTVRRADTIVVLKDGQVVETGDHAHLITIGGEYARLFRMQADDYISDEKEPETHG